MCVSRPAPGAEYCSVSACHRYVAGTVFQDTHRTQSCRVSVAYVFSGLQVICHRARLVVMTRT